MTKNGSRCDWQYQWHESHGDHVVRWFGGSGDSAPEVIGYSQPLTSEEILFVLVLGCRASSRYGLKGRRYCSAAGRSAIRIRSSGVADGQGKWPTMCDERSVPSSDPALAGVSVDGSAVKVLDFIWTIDY